MIEAGRVRINGVVHRDPEMRVETGRDRIEVDGRMVRGEQKLYLMLNKPRSLITTTSDEQGRATVFSCFENENLPRVFPVGRLDKASEGLLLFTNDTSWAARITDPTSHLDKTYHVQADCLADDGLARRIEAGVSEGGDWLKAKRVSVLRTGEKNSWLEIVLDEGKNRHIRRLLAALGLLLACSCWATAALLFGVIMGENFSQDLAEQARAASSRQFWTTTLFSSWLIGLVASSALAGFTLRTNRMLAFLTWLVLLAFVVVAVTLDN
jgi:23S rRNA pseudouridine2605 synthase